MEKRVGSCFLMAIFIVSIYLWTSQKKEEELDITAGSKDFSQRYKGQFANASGITKILG